MIRQHHRPNGHEFEQTPGDSEAQGSLAYCCPWDCKESNMTQKLNNNKALLSGLIFTFCGKGQFGVAQK